MGGVWGAHPFILDKKENITSSLPLSRSGFATVLWKNESHQYKSNKQLLSEVEHDIMNYQNLVSVLSAEAKGFGR